jgi:hypothetical protein
VSCQISNLTEGFAGGSAGHSILSEGLEIESSDFDTENAPHKGDFLWQVVAILIVGVSTVLGRFIICISIILRSIVLQGSVQKTLFNLVRH